MIGLVFSAGFSLVFGLRRYAALLGPFYTVRAGGEAELLRSASYAVVIIAYSRRLLPSRRISHLVPTDLLNTLQTRRAIEGKTKEIAQGKAN